MALTGYVSGQIIQTVPTRGRMKVDRFTADGTWTVPAGVTYAVAHIRAGGGGVGTASSGTGGNSSVAFASGTITATGGNAFNTSGTSGLAAITAGAANSGHGAKMAGRMPLGDEGFTAIAQDGAYIVAGADVTPAASISVTVGGPGTAGTSGAAGGSGYVWIEYLA
jgi:hypothetical protein